MNALLAILDHPLAHRFGWALLHSLWQGALVAVLFGWSRFALRRASANARYLSGCLCLVLLLAVPIGTWLWMGSAPHLAPVQDHGTALPSTPAATASTPALEAAAGSDAGSSELVYRIAGFLESATPWLVAAWSLGVALFSVRLLKGCWRLKTLRTRGTEPFESDWIERLNVLKRRLHVSRPVRMLKSVLVEVPTVIGWLRPVILLPASSLTGLTPSQLEAILIHELAHICRHDYLVNVFQNVVETLMFYHPAVWWISRCVREEREHCCDDLVVKVCGDRVVYARALATLEELRAEAPQLAFAASGGFLLDRIRRLLGLPAAAEPSAWRQACGLALMGVGLVCVIVGVGLMLVPARYQALARIKVEHDTPHQIELSEGQLKFSHDTRSFQTELALIRSPLVLKEVSVDLTLPEIWGKRHGHGGALSPEETLERLRQRIAVNEVRDTSLVEIRVFSDDPAEAAKIANAIAESYRRYRLQSVINSIATRIKALEHRWEEHARELQEAQRNVDVLRTELRISDPDPQSTMPSPMITAEVMREYLKTLTSFRTTEAHREAQLDALKRLERPKLREAIQTALEQPDATLTTLLGELDIAEQRKLSLDQTLTRESPIYKNAELAIQQLNVRIDGRVDGILGGLQNRLEQTRASITALNQSFETAKSNDLAMAEWSRPYYESKRRLAELVQLHASLGMKIAAEKTDLMLPRNSMVVIVDYAVPPSEPSSPKRALNTLLIALGALLGIAGLALLRGRRAPVLSPTPA